MGPTYVSDQEVAYFEPTGWDPSRAPKLCEPVCSNSAVSCSGTLRVARNPVTGEMLNSTFIGKIVPGTGDPTNGIVGRRRHPPAVRHEQAQGGAPGRLRLGHHR